MQGKTRTIIGVLIVSVFVNPLAAGRDGTEPVVTSDLLKLKTMSQIEVSPDGRRAVFVVVSLGRNDKQEYRYFRHIWLLSLEPMESPVPLTFGERNDLSPVWSPDSSRIAFIRSYKGKPQIWILPLSGGEACRITEAEYGAQQPVWSPDGGSILFSSWIPEWAVAAAPPWPCERPGRNWGDTPNWKKLKEAKAADKKEGQEKARPDGSLQEIRAWLAKNASENNPRVFNRLNFQGELSLQTGLSYSHLFVTPVEPGADVLQLTHGFQSFRDADWSPDRKKIICVSVKYNQHPDRIQDSDLWIMNADGSDVKLFLDWPGFLLYQPSYSPDGRLVLFMAASNKYPGYAERRLALIPASGGEPKKLTFDFDRSVGGPLWSFDSKWIYFGTASQGSFPLLRIQASGGQVETIIGGECGIRDYAVSKDRLVYALTEVKNPWELYTADVNGGNSRQMTTFNSAWVDKKKIVYPLEKWLTRPDGIKIQFWVMEPARKEPGKKYPLAVEIHGGPSAMWGPGEFSMWHEFQLLAAWGYGIVYCNPRGSGGYGFDFRHANYRNWGQGPAGDILAAAAEAAQLDWVDADKQVVTGGSYAGYMTAWIVSQDHRFEAAVAQRGVYELSTFFGEGRAWRLVPNHYGGFPWDQEARKFLDANSPQTFVENIRTPLLIIHSDNDIRTGIIQSEMLYKSLKMLNRPVEYVRYPHEGHELSRSGNPHRRMDRLNRIIEFFERYIRH